MATTNIKETKIKIGSTWLPLIQDATTTNKGIVQIGEGLKISDGVLSLPGASIPVYCNITRTNQGYGVYIDDSNNYSGVSSGIVIYNGSETALEPQTCTTTGNVNGGSWGGTFTGTITVTATNRMNGNTRIAKTFDVSGSTIDPHTGADWNTTFTGYVGETFTFSYVQKYGPSRGENITRSTATGNACYVNKVTW